MRIAHLLHAHVERHQLGTVLVEAGYVLARNPDTVRGPDVSFVSSRSIPPHQIPDRFIVGAPDLAVEVLSPDDRPGDVAAKVADYFAAGTRLVWIVDPRAQRIRVRYADGGERVLGIENVLDGEQVVPGFRCGVAEVLG